MAAQTDLTVAIAGFVVVVAEIHLVVVVVDSHLVLVVVVRLVGCFRYTLRPQALRLPFEV